VCRTTNVTSARSKGSPRNHSSAVHCEVSSEAVTKHGEGDGGGEADGDGDGSVGSADGDGEGSGEEEVDAPHCRTVEVAAGAGETSCTGSGFGSTSGATSWTGSGFGSSTVAGGTSSTVQPDTWQSCEVAPFKSLVVPWQVQPFGTAV
jgi:hypothetical protein